MWRKVLNQDFEPWEASLGFPVPHQTGAWVDKNPDPEPPRCFVRGQRHDRDRSDLRRWERQEKFRRYPLSSVKPVSDLSTRAAVKTLVASPSALEERIKLDTSVGGAAVCTYSVTKLDDNLGGRQQGWRRERRGVCLGHPGDNRGRMLLVAVGAARVCH